MRIWKTYILVGIFAAVALACAPWHDAKALEPGTVTAPLVRPMMQLAADTPSEATVFEVQQLQCGGGATSIKTRPPASNGIAKRLVPVTPQGGSPLLSSSRTFAIGLPFIDVFPDVGELASNVLTDMIICPLVGWVFSGVQIIMNVTVNSQLDVKPLLTDGHAPTGSEDNAGLYASWRAFRDFSNVFLVLGVMLVIFSQATSYGLNAYGIRKLLPKIVIAALLINLSYFLCAVLIDVFNILGDSLGDTLMAAISASMTASGTSITEQMNAVTALLASLMLASFPMMIMFGVILIILLIIGFFAIFFLAARQILLAFLVVAAPLAFIAWMLPNTESYFKRWWTTFVKLLAIYPVVSVLTVISYILLVAVGAQF